MSLPVPRPPARPATRRSRSLTAFVLLAVAWLFLMVTGLAPGLATFLAVFALFPGSVLLVRFGKTLMRQSIWRLRNRLILNYILIGVIPVVLILTLVAMAGYIVAGQVAVFLITSELDRRVQSMIEPANILSWSNDRTNERVLNQMAPLLRARFPHISVLIRHGKKAVCYPPDAVVASPASGWLDSSGLVLRDHRYYTWAHRLRDAAEIVLLEPVSNRTLSDLVPNLGAVHFLGDDGQRNLEGEPGIVHIPPPLNRFDREVTWPVQISVADWNRPGRTISRYLMVTTRPSAVLGAIFGEKFAIGQDSLYFFFSVAILFLIVELFSLITGISLTRTVTAAVHNLYQGTQRITAGDFSHRIAVRGNDQLADLSRSFNLMSQNLERLFAVEKEKERLQSELEIAKEVQAQLFPRNVPTLKTMDLTGVCHPARMVSGDYYDYLCLDEHRLALAIGDVAGKGISAALLMASIQSIMRTQLSAESANAATANGAPVRAICTAHAVSQLNKQLYANTSSEKYATFCFGVWDEQRRLFTYTNAGHLPPILVRGETANSLEVTGTVVGAFPAIRYEERTISLSQGDMLVAYTDGISEPENEYGEEFGLERLTELLLRHRHDASEELIARVMEAVEHWTHAQELPDDMTLLVAKVH